MIINMIINTVGVSKVFLKIRTQESTGLRVDFTHVIQVKSDERLFLKKKQRKKNTEKFASVTDLFSCRHQDSTSLKYTFFSALKHGKPTRQYSVIPILIPMGLKLCIPVLLALGKF